MYTKHGKFGNLVDVDASGTKSRTKHIESRLQVTQGHAFWDHWKANEGLRITSNNVGSRVGNFEVSILASPFSRTPLSFGAPYLWNPCKYSHKPYISRNWNHWPTYRQYGSIFIQIFLVGSVKRFCSARVRFGHLRSLILVPIESTCNFLLVRHSNVGPILIIIIAPFQRYCRFLCSWL